MTTAAAIEKAAASREGGTAGKGVRKGEGGAIRLPSRSYVCREKTALYTTYTGLDRDSCIKTT